MSKNHIISLIEGAPLKSLSDSDLNAIRAHTGDCVSCRRAFEAAQISVLLLQERAAETFGPSPFFQARVLATLRERQTGSQRWGWTKVWRAAGALASSMVVTVAALAVFTFVTPGVQTIPGPEMTTALNAYSAEEVLLDQGEAFSDQVSEDQIMNALYGAEDEAAR